MALPHKLLRETEIIEDAMIIICNYIENHTEYPELYRKDISDEIVQLMFKYFKKEFRSRFGI